MPHAHARILLAGLLGVLIAGLVVSLPPKTFTKRPSGDPALYEAIAARVQRGEPYYAAHRDELTKRGYPTASVFNWRTPLLLGAYAAAPRLMQGILLALAVLAVVLTLVLLRDEVPAVTVVGAMLQGGAALPLIIIDGSATVPEAWTGYLLLLSIGAYAFGRPASGALLGLAALFVRELAAPYCVACALIALVRREWCHAAIWIVGGLAYLLYFGAHVTNVAAHSDLTVGPGPWIQFGGLPFVLGATTFNGWFAVSEPWGPATGVALVLAAAWAKSAPLHLRVCGVTYLAFFAAVGQPFNQYWGLVASPVWAIACAYGLGGARRLVRAAVPITG